MHSLLSLIQIGESKQPCLTSLLILSVLEVSFSHLIIAYCNIVPSKDFLLISGDDLLTVPMISIGARGVISVIANAYPEKFAGMVNEALSGNFVKASESLKSRPHVLV